MPLSIFVNHLLAQATPPFRDFAKLACTCKEFHALLGEKVQAHKWATFQKEFLLQLDFVDMFTYAHSLALEETRNIIFPTLGYSECSIHAHVRRDWDFVKEVVTVTVTAVTPWPVRLAEEELLWKGWEFAYVYDTSKSKHSNLGSINLKMRLAAVDHRLAFVQYG
jgi:hypothetical protein